MRTARPWFVQHLTGCIMQAGNAYPSGQLVPSLCTDLYMIQLFRTSCTELDVMSRLLTLKIPRYFLDFTSNTCILSIFMKVCIINNISVVSCTIDNTTFAVSGKVGTFKPGLTTPVGWLVTPNDRPKSVRNRCVIEVFGGVCVLSFGFRIFCWYRGFCHRTGSDLLLFLYVNKLCIIRWCYIPF